jgi:hypothetical protein
VPSGGRLCQPSNKPTAPASLDCFDAATNDIFILQKFLKTSYIQSICLHHGISSYGDSPIHFPGHCILFPVGSAVAASEAVHVCDEACRVRLAWSNQSSMLFVKDAFILIVRSFSRTFTTKKH